MGTGRRSPQAMGWALGGLTLCLLVFGLGVGPEGWEAWWLGPGPAGAADWVMEVRWPRALGTWLAGGLLGLSGALAQGVFRNPLADPFMLGSSTGAALGLALFLVLLGSGAAAVEPGWLASWGALFASFAGAMVAVFCSLVLARGVAHTARLLLSGMVVGMLAGALTHFLLIAQPELLRTLQVYTLGSTVGLGPASAWQLALVLGVCVPLAWLGARALDALALGEAAATSLGLPLARARLALVALMSLATGAAVAHLGLVAFVGLAAPHIVRQWCAPAHRNLLLLSTLAGGSLLLAADVLARWWWAPRELPVGIFTAVLGGGYLLWLMNRRAGPMPRPGVSLDEGAGAPTGGDAAGSTEPGGRHVVEEAGARAGASDRPDRLSPATAFEAMDLSVRLDGVLVLRPTRLRVPSGKWTAVVGANGAGKSTLLRALGGWLPHGGAVSLQGQRAWRRAERAKVQAWLGQAEGDGPELRVRDVVMLGRLPHHGWMGVPSADDHLAVAVAMRRTACEALAARPMASLSGGERQRVFLARLWAQGASVLLMDEPLAHLDPPNQSDWMAWVREHVGQGGTVVSVLHELSVALQADELIVMAAGAVSYQGATADPTTHRALERVFHHRIDVVRAQGRWLVAPAAGLSG